MSATVCAASVQDCPRETAPGQFEFREERSKTTGAPTNHGIVPKGFVDLKDGTPTVHGIDVSKWQSSVDFDRVEQCGARFVYIRLSAGEKGDNELEYRSMWGNARAEGLFVGPYHNLTLADAKGGYQRLAPSEQQNLIQKNVDSARNQARLLIKRLSEVLSLDVVRSAEEKDVALGQPYLPVALDVSRRLQMQGSAADKLAIGAVYRAAICAWIDEFRRDARFAGQPVMLFTLPYVYKDYAIGEADCGLKAAPVWVSHHTKDGDRESNEQNPVLRQVVAELCQPSDGRSRCLFQQYTSYGGFALFQKNEGLDMNRFYGTEDDLTKLLQRAKP